MLFLSLYFSHDFIGEFTTSYKELCRGQNQLNVYEVSADKDCGHYYLPLRFTYDQGPLFVKYIYYNAGSS